MGYIWAEFHYRGPTHHHKTPFNSAAGAVDLASTSCVESQGLDRALSLTGILFRSRCCHRPTAVAAFTACFPQGCHSAMVVVYTAAGPIGQCLGGTRYHTTVCSRPTGIGYYPLHSAHVRGSRICRGAGVPALLWIWLRVSPYLSTPFLAALPAFRGGTNRPSLAGLWPIGSSFTGAALQNDPPTRPTTRKSPKNAIALGDNLVVYPP